LDLRRDYTKGNPVAVRGSLSGGTGVGILIESRMPVASNFNSWLGIVLVRIVSKRSLQKFPKILTSEKGTDE